MIVEKIGFYLSTAEGQFQYVMAARRELGNLLWFNQLQSVVGYMRNHWIMIPLAMGILLVGLWLPD